MVAKNAIDHHRLTWGRLYGQNMPAFRAPIHPQDGAITTDAEIVPS
jgi:hypothetical protein